MYEIVTAKKSFHSVRLGKNRMLEELITEEKEFLKLAGKSRLHYFLFIDPVNGILDGKRVDIFLRRVCLDVTAKAPEGHIIKHSMTFGQYNIHRNKQGVFVLDEAGQEAMKEAHAWQEKHFPKATRGSWGFAKNA